MTHTMQRSIAPLLLLLLLALVMVRPAVAVTPLALDQPADSLHLGSAYSFTVNTPTHGKQVARVDVRCYVGALKVYGVVLDKPYSDTLGGGSSLWVDHGPYPSVTCTATLLVYELHGGHETISQPVATLTWEVR